MNKIKTYTDSKDFPFWNYKRVMQTGNFFYVIKGYDGEDVEADINEMETKFNEIVENYVLETNSKSEDILNYGRYLSANNEKNKLSLIYNIIILKQQCDVIGADITKEEIMSVLDDIKIQKSDDLDKQREYIQTRIDKLNNEVNKLKNIIDKKDNEVVEEVDIDEQFLSVCNGLEMVYDETKISLYQYGVLMKMLVKKIEAINKNNR